jgi:hypothetical protein
MKTRLGFVSNSSSSSFCIYGIQFDSYDEVLRSLQKSDKEFLHGFFVQFNNKYKRELEDNEIAEVTTIDELINAINELGYDMWEFCDDLFKDDKIIRVHTGSEYNAGMVSIGREWRFIGDKETGEEFKESIRKRLEYYFGKKLKLQTIEESFRC